MADAVHDAERLKELQALPLERKIQITQTRIIEWYQHYKGQVCVSFSGGKDSTVLLHIARQIYPDIPAVFSNTGLEYSSIQRFVKTWDNVDIVVPKMNFVQVVSTYGYPLIGKEVAEAIYYARRIRSASTARHSGNSKNRGSKWGDYHRRCLHPNEEDARDKECFRNRRAGVAEEYGSKSIFNKEKYLPLARDAPFLISHYCCFKMKKQPMHKYQHDNGYKPILATLAEESRVRKQGWIRHGCNAFESKNPMSQPMSFWTEQDVLAYIVKYAVPIASVYGEIVSMGDDGNSYPALDLTGHPQCNLKCTGCQRTGCIFCAFGMHLEKGETRFQRLARTHPRQYEYCIGGGEWVDNPFYDPTAPKMDGEWQNWNPKKIWSRNSKGLGMGKVFDLCNEIYGKDFYRYE